MRLLTLAVLFGAACTLPYLIRRLDDRMSARAQAVVYAASLAALVSATVAILLVAMAPEALAAENVVDVFRACFGALKTLLSHPAAHLPALLAAGALAAIAVRSVLAGGRLALAATRVRRQAVSMADEAQARTLPPRWRGNVLVTAQEEVVAYVAGLRAPVVVVSAGLLACLDADEREATLAHEDAHRQLHHPWFLFVISAIAGGLSPIPPVRQAARGLRRALEARADEMTLRHVDVESLASAIGKAALGPAVAGAVTMGQSDTVWRVRRLLAPRKNSHLLPAALLVGALGVLLSTQLITAARASSLLLSVQEAGHHCRIPGWVPPSI